MQLLSLHFSCIVLQLVFQGHPRLPLTGDCSVALQSISVAWELLSVAPLRELVELATGLEASTVPEVSVVHLLENLDNGIRGHEQDIRMLARARISASAAEKKNGIH